MKRIFQFEDPADPRDAGIRWIAADDEAAAIKAAHARKWAPVFDRPYSPDEKTCEIFRDYETARQLKTTRDFVSFGCDIVI